MVHRKNISILAILVSMAAVGLPQTGSWAAIPLTINHQGIVRVSGVPFTGTGQFKFGFVDGEAKWLWTNDGSHTGESVSNAPLTAVSIPVNNGIYHVRLGDTSLTGMSVIPSTVFDGDDVKLRVFFNDGTRGEQLLTPDQPVSSAPFAYHAGHSDDADAVGGVPANEVSLPSLFRRFGGDGSDGSRVLSGTADLGAVVRQYTSLEIQADATLRIDQGWGFIGVQGTCVIAGTVTADGKGEPGGAGSAGLGQQTAGTSATGKVSSESVPLCVAGAGGGGGSGLITALGAGQAGGGAGGSGGTMTQGLSSTPGKPGAPISPVRIQVYSVGGLGDGIQNGFAGPFEHLLFHRGAGGGGGGELLGASGAGGNGGGVIYIECRNLVLTGTMTANGMNGGNGGGSSGGGGGGGGVVLVRAKTITTNTGTVTANGGTGGNGAARGGNGANGFVAVVELTD